MRIGSTMATIDTTALVASSAVLTTGAATPAVLTLSTGRAVALAPWTTSEITMPATTGNHWLPAKKSPGSPTVTVSDADAAPKTSPPDAGRTAVWTTSFTLSTAGTLSATTSIASSTDRMPMTQPFSSQVQPEGSVRRSV